MADANPVVVDTNILFSALLRNKSSFAEILLHTDQPFYAGELVLVELFKHKEKLIRLSHLSEEEVVRFYYILVKRLNIHRENLIAAAHWSTACDLCRDIDENDTPHLALTLALDGRLWTGDKQLKEKLQAKGFDRFFEPEQ